MYCQSGSLVGCGPGPAAGARDSVSIDNTLQIKSVCITTKQTYNPVLAMSNKRKIEKKTRKLGREQEREVEKQNLNELKDLV